MYPSYLKVLVSLLKYPFLSLCCCTVDGPYGLHPGRPSMTCSHGHQTVAHSCRVIQQFSHQSKFSCSGSTHTYSKCPALEVQFHSLIISIYVYIYIYMHRYIIYLYIYICICACVYVQYIYLYKYTYIYIYIYLDRVRQNWISSLLSSRRFFTQKRWANC